MFSSGADSFSPANRLHPHYQRANPTISRASPFASVVDNNHHSFTYAASVAERNGLKPYGRNPPDHGLKPRGLRRVQTVTGAGGKQSSLSRSADLSDRFWILLRAGFEFKTRRRPFARTGTGRYHDGPRGIGGEEQSRSTPPDARPTPCGLRSAQPQIRDGPGLPDHHGTGERVFAIACFCTRIRGFRSATT